MTTGGVTTVGGVTGGVTTGGVTGFVTTGGVTGVGVGVTGAVGVVYYVVEDPVPVVVSDGVVGVVGVVVAGLAFAV